jgi:acyl CoA:acetate/3-ketoacid CoA transferase alpha subunit
VIDRTVAGAEAAVANVADGAVVMIGRFGTAGISAPPP